MIRHRVSAIIFMILTLLLSSGCALLGGTDDAEVKASNIKFNPPSSPFKKVSVSSADHVFQSEKTGSTIAVNSLCQKYVDVKLTHLRDNILAGVEQLKTESETDITYNDREGKRVVALGTMDVIKVKVDLLIFKKNNCTFDLTYISRPEFYATEKRHFDDFLARFKVP
ncbi:MAG: hypothetical protein IT289_02265 [Oligoflexia bacterium]|nr:hypothetical protein [Oligoflexia bacterium]